MQTFMSKTNNVQIYFAWLYGFMKKHPCIVAGWFIFQTLILLWLKLPYDPVKGRTFIFNAFMFPLGFSVVLLLSKCFCHRWGRVFFPAFWYQLTLFPYWIVPGFEPQKIYFPASFINSDTVFFLPLFAVLAFILASLYKYGDTGCFFPAIANKRVLGVVVLLFALMFAQHIFRFGNYTPMGEKKIRDGDKYASADYEGFFGIGYSSCDAFHHLSPAGFFLGNFKLQSGLVINDRPVAGYFMSQLSLFFHPYIAGRLLLFIFYALIVLSTFTLCYQIFKFDIMIAFAVAVVLMSANSLLNNATILNVYIHIFSSFPIVAYCLHKMRIFDDEMTFTDLFLYSGLVTFISIGYFPYYYSLFHLLVYVAFALYYKVERQTSFVTYNSRKNLCSLSILFVAPFIVKFCWIKLLSHYSVLGRIGNRSINDHYFDNLLRIPGLFLDDPLRIINLLSDNAGTLILNYTGYMSEDGFERWTILGVFGLLFILILPKFMPGKAAIVQYSIIVSFFIISYVGGLVASLFPHEKWSFNIPLSDFRSTGGYLAFILAQILGCYFLVQRLNDVSQKAFGRSFSIRSLQVFVLCFAGVVYLMSFSGVLDVWLKFGHINPMYNEYFHSLPLF
jgi:hypothetical protein